MVTFTQHMVYLRSMPNLTRTQSRHLVVSQQTKSIITTTITLVQQQVLSHPVESTVFHQVAHIMVDLPCLKLPTKLILSNQLALSSSGHQFHKVSLSQLVTRFNNKMPSEVVIKIKLNPLSTCLLQLARSHHHPRAWPISHSTKDLHSYSILLLTQSKLFLINNHSNSLTATVHPWAQATAELDPISGRQCPNHRAISFSRCHRDTRRLNPTINTRPPNLRVLNSLNTPAMILLQTLLQVTSNSNRLVLPLM